MHRHIVYQAYGSKDNLHECCFSVASLKRQECLLENVKLHVFTDRKEYLEQLLTVPVIYHEMDSMRIKEWRGEIDFTHRVKIRILQQLSGEIQKGMILYLDSDVIAIDGLQTLWQNIHDGRFAMHTKEGNILRSPIAIFKKIIPVIQHGVAEGMMTTSDFDIWNAGVLGFRAEQSFLLDDVLALTDNLYVLKRKHIIEQASFSYVFQQAGDLLAADDVFYHYWKLKEFREILRQIYMLTPDRRDEIIDKMLEKKTIQLLVSAKSDYYSNTTNKILRWLIAKKWVIPSLDKFTLLV